jgi:hypothetical protein
LVPQLETGKISCVRHPCWGRLSPRQQVNNARTDHKVSAWNRIFLALMRAAFLLQLQPPTIWMPVQAVRLHVDPARIAPATERGTILDSPADRFPIKGTIFVIVHLKNGAIIALMQRRVGVAGFNRLSLPIRQDMGCSTNASGSYGTTAPHNGRGVAMYYFVLRRVDGCDSDRFRR